ncbi:hypothetical protein BDW22DRAFT_1361988 [Trametopsis cervina]|nr:hypothetical protein BDW22DRAFT_1361988 [Trametopsis cervina]
MFVRAYVRVGTRTVTPCFRRCTHRKVTHDLPPTFRTALLFQKLLRLPEATELYTHRYLVISKSKPTCTVRPYALNNRFVKGDTPTGGILRLHDLDDILNNTKTSGTAFKERVPDGRLPSTQSSLLYAPLVLHILLKNTDTLEEVIKTLVILENSLPVTSKLLQPVIIIATVAKLAELRLVAPLRGLIGTFQECPMATAVHYRLLLRALSLAPASTETSSLALLLIETMSKKGYQLGRKRVYNALLRPSFTTLAIASQVERYTNVHRSKLLASHVASLFRLMVTRRRRRKALTYMNRLNDMDEPAKGSRLSRPKLVGRLIRYLAAFREQAAAHRHILRMANIDDTSEKPTRERHAEAREKDSKTREKRATTDKHPVYIAPTRSGPRRRVIRRPEDGNLLPSELARVNVLSTGAGELSDEEAPRQWLSVLRIASRDPILTARNLMSIFSKGRRKFSVTLSAYEVTIRGLVRKHGFARAAALWREVRRKGLPLGRASLALGIRALAHADHIDQAYALLEETNAAWEAYKALPVSDEPPLIVPKPVDITAINQFMVALRRRGRPDAVFALWDAMKPLYKLSPDVYTLNVVLGTARWASKYDQSLSGAFRSVLGGLGVRGSRSLPAVREDATPQERRLEISAHIATILAPGMNITVTGQWGSESAPSVALRIAVHVFLGNWPHLRTLRPPVRATRRAGSDPALSPFSDLYRTLANRAPDDLPPTPLLQLLPDHTPPYPFPYIYPTDLTFRVFIDLLATESLHTEIPLALTWMRSLGVKPAKVTLATALVHWMEVGLDAPLIERIKGGQNRSPYSMLMAWMYGWVGEEGMPTSKEMSSEMARLAFFRNARYDNSRGLVVTNFKGRTLRRTTHIRQ